MAHSTTPSQQKILSANSENDGANLHLARRAKISRLPVETKKAIIAALAPNYSEEQVEQMRDAVMSAHASMASKREEFFIPPTVRDRYICQVCGNRDPRYFTHDRAGGDVSKHKVAWIAALRCVDR